MKNILATSMFLLAAIFFSTSAMGATATTGASTSVSYDCPKKTNQECYPLGQGGGRTCDPKTNGLNAMNKNNQAVTAAQQKIIDQATAALKKGNEGLIDKLMDCISGINNAIFTSLGDINIGEIFESIMKELKEAACNFAKEKTQEYLQKALAQFSFDLPFGLGQVGPNTSVLGYTIMTTGVGGTLQGQSQRILMQGKQQGNMAWIMFNNAGNLSSRLAGGNMTNIDDLLQKGWNLIFVK